MVGLARHIFRRRRSVSPSEDDRHAQVRCSGSRCKMLHPKSLITVALLCLYCATTANAGEIPAPQDILYPGTLTLSVDLTDLDRRLFMVRESMPVKPGPLTLLYPQWLPGTHGPNGPVNLLTGLIITARGRRLPWLRDPVNMYAFHHRRARSYGSRRPRISVRLASDRRARTNRRHAGNPRPAVEHGRALSRRLLREPDIGKGRRKDRRAGNSARHWT